MPKQIDLILKAARDDGDTRFGCGLSFWDFDLDDPRIRSGLARRGLTKALAMSDLIDTLLEIDQAERERTRKETAFMQYCHEKRDDLKVFYVYNTANRSLVIIARDVACARRFAKYAGHIKEEKNGRVMVMKPERENELRCSGDPLGRALREGKPGVIERIGENVVIRDRGSVFTPITVVRTDSHNV